MNEFALTLFALTMAVPAPRAAESPAAGRGKVAITTSSSAAREAYLIGRDLFERLRGQEARPFFERAVVADPSFALAHLGLANTQPSAKEFSAVLARAVALADKVSDGERLMIQGAEAGGRGDNDRQAKLYQELIAAYPNDERALLLLGNAHFGAQLYPQAIVQYERAAAIAPGFSQIYNQLGYSYRFLGEMAKAEAAFKKYTEVLPADPNPYDSYAELLMKLGRFDEAIALYRKALEVRPDFVNSRFGIASCLDLQGKGDEARREIDAMLAKAEDDGQRRAGLFAKTVSYAFEGKLEAVQAEMDRQYALAEKIHDARAMAGDLVVMGDIALEAGDVAGAEGRYRRALEVVEGAPDVTAANKDNQRRLAIYNGAKVALAKGDLATAKAQSSSLTEKVAASGSAFQKRLAHEIIGRIALAEKQWDRAIGALEQSNLLDPYNVYRLSQAHAGRGDAARAQKLMGDARQDNTLTNLNLAWVRLKTKAG